MAEKIELIPGEKVPDDETHTTHKSTVFIVILITRQIDQYYITESVYFFFLCYINQPFLMFTKDPIGKRIQHIKNLCTGLSQSIKITVLDISVKIKIHRRFCRFVAHLKKWSDVHIKAQIGKSRGDDLCTSVMSILSHFGNQQTWISAFMLLELHDPEP